jgi:hypothetical protein
MGQDYDTAEIAAGMRILGIREPQYDYAARSRAQYDAAVSGTPHSRLHSVLATHDSNRGQREALAARGASWSRRANEREAVRYRRARRQDSRDERQETVKGARDLAKLTGLSVRDSLAVLVRLSRASSTRLGTYCAALVRGESGHGYMLRKLAATAEPKAAALSTNGAPGHHKGTSSADLGTSSGCTCHTDAARHTDAGVLAYVFRLIAQPLDTQPPALLDRLGHLTRKIAQDWDQQERLALLLGVGCYSTRGDPPRAKHALILLRGSQEPNAPSAARQGATRPLTGVASLKACA